MAWWKRDGAIDESWGEIATPEYPPPADNPTEVIAPKARQVRDPRGSTYMIDQWQSKDLPMVAEWDAESAIQWGYIANVYVWACANAIARDLSSCAFRVGADPEKPTDYDRKNQVAWLLGPTPGTPTPNLTARQLWAWSIIQRLITGRWCWEIEWDSRGIIPTALWPLPSSKIQPFASDKPGEWFRAFKYGYSSKAVIYRPDEVLYAWNPAANDWRQAESSLQAARLDISVAVMQDRYDYAFLKNDARPAAVVVHEEFNEDSQRDAWRARFYRDHRGVDNAGSIEFMETQPGGASPKEALAVQVLGLSQKDAEFIARYKEKVRGICVALGVPMSRLGDSSERTFSNADVETLNYWKDTILPLAAELSEAVSLRFSTYLSGKVGWFDFSKVEALKQKPKMNPYEGLALSKGGVVGRRELRAELGLVPMDQLDKADQDELQLLWNLNLATIAAQIDPSVVGAIVPQLAPVAPPPALPPAPADVPPADVVPPVDVPALPPAPAAPAAASKEKWKIPAISSRSVFPDGDHSLWSGPARRAVTAQRAAQNVDALETMWRKRIQKLLDYQLTTTLSRLKGKRGRAAIRSAVPSPDAVFDKSYWESHTLDEAAALYEQVFTVAGAAAAAKLGIVFDLSSEHATQFIQDRAKMLAGQITDTTYEGIKDAMREGVDAGEGIDEIADRIRGLFEQTYASRAETVARTEVISSYNGSTLTVAMDAGEDVAAGKEWIATSDARVRASHGDADGQVVQFDDLFQVGGSELAYPGDPAGDPGEIVNCRCTIGILSPEEMKSARQANRTYRYATVEQLAVRLAAGQIDLDAMLAELEKGAQVGR